MRSCENCIYSDICDCAEVCEDFYPVRGYKYIKLHEYEDALRERAREYQEIVDELES
jgi:hypothetical protein